MKTTKWMALMALACLAILARPTFGNEVAEAFMQALEAGDFESAHAMLDGDVADQSTEPLLIQTWEALPAQLAEYRGRGPVRRETIGPSKPFRDLAQGLAQRGIASLRYDKRTLVQPARFETGAYTVDDDLAEFIHSRREGQR